MNLNDAIQRVQQAVTACDCIVTFTPEGTCTIIPHSSRPKSYELAGYLGSKESAIYAGRPCVDNCED